jgi:aryl carrier-like protein
MLASVWADVLGYDRIGVFDSFFELGGNSLLATQLAHRLQSVCKIDVPLRSLLDRPTVAALADLVDKGRMPPADAPEMEAMLDVIEEMSEESAQSLLDVDLPMDVDVPSVAQWPER